jgi:hypothetical protein
MILRVDRIASAVLILYASGNAIAGGLAYTCEVAHVYAVSDCGSLIPSALEKNMRGSLFSVSRVTGEIIGEVIPTLMAKSTRVVNKGSTKNSFKTTADFGGQYQLLEIQESRSGDVKPFVATSMGGPGRSEGRS